MEAKDDGDLHGGQRSTEVKCSIFRIWFILYTLPFLSYEQYHKEIFSALKDGGGSHIDMVYVYVPAFWGPFSQNLV